MKKTKYHVYVIELRTPKGVAKRGLGDVYVGSSALSPPERLQHHRTSPKGSRHVRRRGVRLLPRLYQGIPTFATREEAKRAEKHLANALHSQGYKVYGACSPRTSPDCVL